MTKPAAVERPRATPDPRTIPATMKTTSAVLSVLLLPCALAWGAEPAQPAKKPVFRDAATHEQLALALRKAEQRDPMKKLTPVEGEDPSKVNRPMDLMEQSDIICFRGFATLVPKRAIISAPENYKKYLKLEPGARIVGWKDFYSRNRGWITTVEVSRVQAEGVEAISEDTRDQIGKSANLVVATLQGGPISVLPPVKPEEEGEDSKTDEANPTTTN